MGNDTEAQINRLEVAVAEHTVQHKTTTETLQRITTAIEDQVRLSEKVIALDSRHQESARVLHERLDKQEQADKELLVKIDVNHAQIVRWSGALGAVASTLTLLALATKLLGVEAG